jgi:glycosyltransferase involved in cell wall biosynthesis
MSKRLISVIVPTRDRPDTLRQALASIRSLESDDVTFEILVGDNGADPETRKVASDFSAIHIPVREKGAAAARNAGLKAATGEFFAFLDDDDVWLPAHIRQHLEFFDANPEIEAVLAQVIPVDNDLRELDEPWPVRAPSAPDALVKSMLSGYYPQIGATIVRASVRDAIGYFDLALLGDQDWDWQLRIARRRKMAYLKLPCVLFRQRPPGSYDALRFRRLGFARKVFLRHALPEWRVWGSLKGISNSYRDVMWQYYEYFVEAAVARAEAGEKGTALRAILGALGVFPFRGIYHLVAPKPLRRALIASLLSHGPPKPASL